MRPSSQALVTKSTLCPDKGHFSQTWRVMPSDIFFCRDSLILQNPRTTITASLNWSQTFWPMVRWGLTDDTHRISASTSKSSAGAELDDASAFLPSNNLLTQLMYVGSCPMNSQAVCLLFGTMFLGILHSTNSPFVGSTYLDISSGDKYSMYFFNGVTLSLHAPY